MAAYVDFVYYRDVFLGTAIAEAAFPQLALRASEIVDQLTFQRAVGNTTYATQIKKATCAVAEVLQRDSALGSDGEGVVSESVGSHSVTYASGSSKQQTFLQRHGTAARIYLASTGLMYAGLLEGE